jgi:hypothetical protein
LQKEKMTKGHGYFGFPYNKTSKGGQPFSLIVIFFADGFHVETPKNHE